MVKEGLSENEKRTLLGIVKYPTLNDRQMSEQIGIKMSTVTAIKNRLKDMGYFMTVRVPNLQNLGAEILSVSYAETNPALKKKAQVDIGHRLIEGFDPMFFIGAGPRTRFSMSMHRNYSAASLTHDGVFDLYSRSGFLIPGGYHVVHLPFDQMKVYNFFDYTQLLELTFDIKLPSRPWDALVHDGEYGAVRTRKLSRIERKVLKGLVQNPDLLDSNISKRIDVTRQSVTKMRKRFMDEDLFFTLRIPDLESLGFRIMALVHTTYKPTSSMGDRAGPLKEIFPRLPIVFKTETDREGVELVATKDFSEMDAYLNRMVSHLRGMDVIEEDPRTMLFDLGAFTAIKNHVYGPGLARMVEQE